MIVPRPAGDVRRQRAVAVFGAVALLVGLHAGLRGTGVPTLTSGRAVIRRLDPLLLERYAAPPPPPSATDPRPAAAEPRSTEVALEREVGDAIEGLLERLGGGGVPAAGPPTREAPAGQELGLARVPGERMTEIFGDQDEGTALPVAPRRANARPPAAGGGIALAAGAPTTGRVAPSAVTPAPAVRPTAGRARATSGDRDVVIAEHAPERLNRSEVDVLEEWMRAHPAALPVGVRQHLNYSDAFLTSRDELTSDGRAIDVFLMLNPSLRELHIVLVEDDRSVYLIDRGFQEQSRSLREGVVRRLDGEIVAINSRAGAASGVRAREFYNVFLSWWEAARNDAR